MRQAKAPPWMPQPHSGRLMGTAYVQIPLHGNLSLLALVGFEVIVFEVK